MIAAAYMPASPVSRIFNPIAISTMPPALSAFVLYFNPNILPALTPEAEQMKVTQPMVSAAGRMDTSMKANVIPTAMASILVAIARISMEHSVMEASMGLVFSVDSRSILIPIKVKRIDETQ